MSDRQTILLVEDSPDDIDLAVRAFEKNGVGHTLVVARDGQEALDYLFRAGRYRDREERSPDVVLLDLKLPRVAGLDVLRRLRADDRTRRLPVVVLTSSDEQVDIGRAYDLGANSFIRKPVDFVRFVEAVRQLSTYWLTLNEAPGAARRVP